MRKFFFEKYCILLSLTTMYNNLIVSHVNKPRYLDISRYAIYQYGLTLYQYSDIALKRYNIRYIVASLAAI